MQLTTPYIYICTVSKFNLPEFEACLLHKPAHIVLVVSDHKDAQQGAEQLTSLLKTELPNSVIHQPATHYHNGCLTLTGDNIAECVSWITHVLQPLIESIEKKAPAVQPFQRYLNTTGGTKAMLLALTTSLKWDKLDYKPIQQQTLQCITPNLTDLPNPAALSQSNDLVLTDASPLSVAKLYSKSIHEDKPNPLCRHDTSSALAQTIWNALETDNTSVKAFFSGLDKLWSQQRTSHQTKKIHITWENFYQLPITDLQNNNTCTNIPFAFLDQLQQLAPKAISYNQNSLILPGNSAEKHHKYLKRWISADWLEQLVFQWLQNSGIPTTAIARNLQAGTTNNSSSYREADLFIHYQAKSSIIEVKADLPEGKELKELEQQLSSLGDRFGRTQKILFIGPLLSQKLENSKRLESFQLRCKANSVKLCQTKKELINYFHKQ